MNSVTKSSSYYGALRRDLLALVPHDVASVLDIGCGTGNLGHELRTRTGCRVTGVEIVPVVAEEASQKLDVVIAEAADQAILKLPDSAFDLLIMADSLEHLANPNDFLRNVRRVLTPNAWFLISVPNVAHWSVVRMLAQGQWNYAPGGIMDDTHLRWFTLNSIATILQSVGFQIDRIEAEMFGGPGMPRRFLKACKALNMDMRSMQIESQCYQYRILGRVKDATTDATNSFEDLLSQLAGNAREAYWRHELADGRRKWLWRNYAPGLLVTLVNRIKSGLS